jgi:hypothetical protein
MLSFNDLQEKKTNIKINPKKEDVMEGDKTLNHGEDCGCMKCDKRRRKDELGDEKTVSTEETAYVSQEEVSEESDQSIGEKETSGLLTFGQFAEGLSIDDQMRISREYNRKSPEEKKAANKKAMGNVKKVAPKKDTRTDAQKMTDATGPRPGSRYRGD